MRERLGRLLLVVAAISLFCQLLAPVGAFRVVAQAASDPLAFAMVCTGQHDGAAPGTPSGDSDRKCCGFCAAAQSGAAALDPPTIAYAVVQQRYQRVAWLTSKQLVAPQRIGSNAQARAPPLAA